VLLLLTGGMILDTTISTTSIYGAVGLWLFGLVRFARQCPAARRAARSEEVHS